MTVFHIGVDGVDGLSVANLPVSECACARLKGPELQAMVMCDVFQRQPQSLTEQVAYRLSIAQTVPNYLTFPEGDFCGVCR